MCVVPPHHFRFLSVDLESYLRSGVPEAICVFFHYRCHVETTYNVAIYLPESYTKQKASIASAKRTYIILVTVFDMQFVSSRSLA